MSDLRALAKGIHRMCQAMPLTDTTVQEMVLTSIMFAEASVSNSPQRKELLDEFYRVAQQGD